MAQKVPFSDQGMITKNVHTLYPAATFDLKPTVLEILGIKPPEVNEQNPGRDPSLLPSFVFLF